MDCPCRLKAGPNLGWKWVQTNSKMTSFYFVVALGRGFCPHVHKDTWEDEVHGLVGISLIPTYWSCPNSTGESSPTIPFVVVAIKLVLAATCSTEKVLLRTDF